MNKKYINLKKHILSSSLVGSMALFTASSGVCESSHSPSTLQDSAKAVEYFEYELDFKTNPYGVNRIIDGGAKNVTIVDVRAAKDFANGHIPGAINIPYDQYNGFEGSETNFSGLRKNGFNYIYCYEHLCNLAQKAAKKFASLGYPVKEMVGGFEEWKNHKYSIVK
jgi:rhodanese-related sulfurtransferase